MKETIEQCGVGTLKLLMGHRRQRLYEKSALNVSALLDDGPTSC